MIRSVVMFMLWASAVLGQTRSQNYQLLLQNISNEPRLHGKCGLPAFAALQQAAQQQPALAALLKRTFSRPQLQRSYVTPGGKFRFHYDVTGVNAVNPTSTQVAGVPDYIYEAGLAARRAYDLLHVQLGFDLPMSDQNVDGPEYDFYVVDEPADRYGETAWDFLDATGRAAGYSFVDNNFAGYNTTGLAALRVTVAHEYFHGVQLNYRFRDEDIYFLEMSSTWFEDFAYDEVNDYYFYLRDFFNNPNTPLAKTDGYEASVWLHYLVKRTRTSRLMLDLWKRVKTEPAILSFKSILEAAPYNLPFVQAFSEFNVWCYFTGGRADTARYFEEGDKYPQIKFAQTAAISRDTTISGGLGAVAANFYRILRNPQSFQVFLPAAQSNRWMVSVLYKNERQQYRLSRNDGLTPIDVPIANPAKGDTFVVVVANTSLTANGSNYQLQLKPAGNLQLMIVLENPWPNPFKPLKSASSAGAITFPFRINLRASLDAAVIREDGKVMKQYDLGELPADIYPEELSWDGHDESGNRAASGVYFLRLWSGAAHGLTKFVLVN